MIYDQFKTARHQNRKCFALLIDPDDIDQAGLFRLKSYIDQARVDFIFLGGSLVREDRMDMSIRFLKEHFSIPVILFPGDQYQIHPDADALLFLSLISGRNPDLLIGKHVLAAPHIRRTGLQVLPTGYILVDGGKPTTVSYMSQTFPIPHDKSDIALSTALAGEMLGLKLIYLDTGSGAERTVSHKMIRRIRSEIQVPIIVGGGIRTGEQAGEICRAGADVIVVGTAIERNPERLIELSEAVYAFNKVNELS